MRTLAAVLPFLFMLSSVVVFTVLLGLFYLTTLQPALEQLRTALTVLTP